MKPLLLIFTFAATLFTVSEASGREQTANRKVKAPNCEVPKCCLHARIPRPGSRVRAESGLTPAPSEQTWQEKMASKGSGS